MTLAPGMVVQIKSGGPLMTIETVDGDTCTCAWTEKGVVKQKGFQSAALIEAAEPDSSVLIRIDLRSLEYVADAKTGEKLRVLSLDCEPDSGGASRRYAVSQVKPWDDDAE